MTKREVYVGILIGIAVIVIAAYEAIKSPSMTTISVAIVFALMTVELIRMMLTIFEEELTKKFAKK